MAVEAVTPKPGISTADPAPWRAWIARHKALIAGVVLGLVAAVMLFAGLDQPPDLAFDEHHYVKAARALVAFTENTNPEHPLVAKQLIAGAIALFGDHPAAWRAPGAAMGVITIISLYALAWALFGTVSAALTAGVAALLNQLVFVQARIAMLDAYMAAFLMAALAVFALAAHPRDPARAHTRAAFVATGVLLGLAVGSKWTAAPFVALILAAVLGARVWASVRERRGVLACIASGDFAAWPRASALDAVAWIGAVSVLVYLATFWPLLVLRNDGADLWGLVTFQGVMLQKQTAPLGDHHQISYWWSWLLPVKAQWYYFKDIDGVRRALLFFGNPVILWTAYGALLACVYRGVRAKDWRYLSVSVLILFSYLMWPAMPKKISFYFYFYNTAILLGLALAGVQHAFFDPARSRVGSAMTLGFFAAAAAVFVYFYPVLAARPIGGGEEWLRWRWFSTWS